MRMNRIKQERNGQKENRKDRTMGRKTVRWKETKKREEGIEEGRNEVKNGKSTRK